MSKSLWEIDTKKSEVVPTEMSDIFEKDVCSGMMNV